MIEPCECFQNWVKILLFLSRGYQFEQYSSFRVCHGINKNTYVRALWLDPKTSQDNIISINIYSYCKKWPNTTEGVKNNLILHRQVTITV